MSVKWPVLPDLEDPRGQVLWKVVSAWTVLGGSRPEISGGWGGRGEAFCVRAASQARGEGVTPRGLRGARLPGRQGRWAMLCRDSHLGTGLVGASPGRASWELERCAWLVPGGFSGA